MIPLSWWVYSPNAPGSHSVRLIPDRQGLDYLAGSYEIRDGVSYTDHIRLYSVRFAEGKPRLLYRFPSNSANRVGTAVEGHWSFDGRDAVFRYFPASKFWQL
jgi:hypothetical protein